MKPPIPGQRHLGQRHLADVARQHHHRQGDARDGQRGDEREAEDALSAIIRITPTAKQAAAVRSGVVAAKPIDGLRSAVSPPRASTVQERSAITVMTTNGWRHRRPCWAKPVHTVMS